MEVPILWSDSPEYLHFLLAFYFAADLYFARLNLDFIFKKLAIWFMGVAPQLRKAERGGRVTMARARARRALKNKINNCAESIWKLTYYTIVEIWFLNLTCAEPWFSDTQEWIKGWPNHELKFLLSVYYMFQCAFPMYSIVSLRCWETRTEGYPVVMAHRIVTTVLIAASYITGFFRIGTIVLGLHDASEILVEATLIFKYANKMYGASIFFELFALSWVLLRLMIFPLWVIKASSYDFLRYMDVSKGYEKMLYYVFNTMLLTLLVFHIYWWKFIILMIFKQLRIRGRIRGDIRSDSEDD